MAGLAQVIGWLFVGVGVLVIAGGFFGDDYPVGVVLFPALGIIIGGLSIGLLGEIAMDLRALRSGGGDDTRVITAMMGELSADLRALRGDLSSRGN